MVSIGILALQGDFAAHATALGRAGTGALEVRRVQELAALDGLIIPGGESTTLLNLMQDEPWFDALRRFAGRGSAIWGTCAGAILLARRVIPEQPSLGLVDAEIERNAYGRQVDSFESEIELSTDEKPLRAMFIRAPRFRSVGSGVKVLARLDGEPVLVRQGRVLAGTFHPELTTDPRLHRRFVDIAGQARTTLYPPSSSPDSHVNVVP